MWAIIFFTSSELASVFLISPHFSPQDPLYFFCLIPSLPFVLLLVSVSWLESKLLSSFCCWCVCGGSCAETRTRAEQTEIASSPLAELQPTILCNHYTHIHKGTKQSMCLTMPPTINQPLHNYTNKPHQDDSDQPLNTDL